MWDYSDAWVRHFLSEYSSGHCRETYKTQQQHKSCLGHIVIWAGPALWLWNVEHTFAAPAHWPHTDRRGGLHIRWSTQCVRPWDFILHQVWGLVQLFMPVLRGLFWVNVAWGSVRYQALCSLKVCQEMHMRLAERRRLDLYWVNRKSSEI